METKKKVEIVVETTDGQIVSVGDIVTMTCSGVQLIGKFAGIDAKGNWKFEGAGMSSKDVFFTKAPRSIQKMFLADIKILSKGEEFHFEQFMNAPVESEDK